MRMLPTIGLLSSALLAGLQSAALAQAPAPLPVTESNVIAAPRGERLLMLINLEPQRAALKGMTDAAVKDVLTETGKAQAARILTLAQYQGKFASVETIYAYVTSMDEYNRPNFGGMTRLGTASFKKSGQTVELDKIDLNLQLFKQ
jgi:hypothetical protein